MASSVLKLLRPPTAAKAVRLIATGKLHGGECPVCERRTLFVELGPWLRDQYKCLFCRSIPRFRAVIHLLETRFPAWRTLKIHESSPDGASSRKLQRECPRYVATQFYPDVRPGTFKDGVRSENLEASTFAEESFDLVVTQDVFEHVLNPRAAFADIARTLRPGGAHVFTVPYYRGKPTFTRAVSGADGIEHLAPPDFHCNPADREGGSLVVTEWGDDLPQIVFESSSLETSIYQMHDPKRGIVGEFLEVFVTAKPA